jgi:hypothetical protein
MRNPKPGSKPVIRSVPKEAQDEVWRQVQDIAADYALEFYLRGKSIYITERDEPLCRLDYTGDLKEWELAVYQYSRGGYSKDEFLVRKRGPPRDLVVEALTYYRLMNQPPLY